MEMSTSDPWHPLIQMLLFSVI